MGELASRGKGEEGIARQIEHLLDPPAGNLLADGRCGTACMERGVHVPGRGEPVAARADGNAPPITQAKNRPLADPSCPPAVAATRSSTTVSAGVPSDPRVRSSRFRSSARPTVVATGRSARPPRNSTACSQAREDSGLDAHDRHPSQPRRDRRQRTWASFRFLLSNSKSGSGQRDRTLSQVPAGHPGRCRARGRGWVAGHGEMRPRRSRRSSCSPDRIPAPSIGRATSAERPSPADGAGSRGRPGRPASAGRAGARR